MAAASVTRASIELLQAMADQRDACVYRPEVVLCCIAALRAAEGEGRLFGSAMQARARNRHLGPALGRRAAARGDRAVRRQAARGAAVREPMVCQRAPNSWQPAIPAT
jgi:F0F1-type ATP synthase membrane subunit c/vacuolar-type H+-ATPase subunit K